MEIRLSLKSNFLDLFLRVFFFLLLFKKVSLMLVSDKFIVRSVSMIRLRQLHKLQALNDSCCSSSSTSPLLVLCALPADQVLVEFTIDCEGIPVDKKFTTASVCLNKVCWFQICFALDNKHVCLKEKQKKS